MGEEDEEEQLFSSLTHIMIPHNLLTPTPGELVDQ